jgi:hypothetical protein
MINKNTYGNNITQQPVTSVFGMLSIFTFYTGDYQCSL